jgi:hypothetical protein
MAGIPVRAAVLWLLLGPVLGTVGLIAGTWVLPIAVALWFDTISLADIPIGWGGSARPPELWIDPEADHRAYNLAEALGAFVAIPVALAFGLLGLHLWRFLVVKKFKWMTAEEVRELRKRQRQIM